MGNLVGVVAAVSAGGAGAVFWMWVTALLGASTSFVESTLAQKYRQPDPLYGGQRGGPAYYIHVLAERKRGKRLRHSIIAVLFAISGLICWCGISLGKSVGSAFPCHSPSRPACRGWGGGGGPPAVFARGRNPRGWHPAGRAGLVCRSGGGPLRGVIARCPPGWGAAFPEAFGRRQGTAGGFGAVRRNGAKRGLFSKEAGSGSAPCAAAAASCDDPVKMGFVQALGVLIDTVVICSCTAFMMLLAPAKSS